MTEAPEQLGEAISARDGVVGLPRWFWIGFAIICLFKLVLVSQDEILVFSDDDLGWARIAGSWYWGTSYGPYTHFRQPGYPLFLVASDLLGIPTRVSIELVWFACVGVTCAAVRKCGMAPLAALIVAAGLIVHPWNLNINNRLLVDSFYAPMFVAFLAASAAALVSEERRSQWRWGLAAGLAGALAANTRQESVLVTASISVTAAAALALGAAGHADRRRVMHTLVFAAVIPWAVTQGVTHAFKFANYRQIGSYVTYDFDMSGYKALYRALLAIPPETPDLRLAIPRDAREKAYAASPTFAQLKPHLESGPEVAVFAEACKQQTGAEHEFGGWTCWALRQAAWDSAGPAGWKSARELDAFYARAAAELRQAMSEGRLAHRWVPVSFLPPEWGKLVRAVPVGVGAAIRQGMLRPPRPGSIRSFDLGAPTAEVFDNVANRRSGAARIAFGEKVEGDWWHRRPAIRSMRAVKELISAAWPVVAGVSLGLSVLGTVAGLFVVRRSRLQPRWYVLVALIWAAIVARVFVVALVDTTGVLAQARYMLVPDMLVIVLALTGVQGLVAIGGRKRGTGGLSTRAPVV